MLNFIKRYWPTALATLILLTALTGVYAKYVMDQALTGQASITAKLGTITLLEHKPTKDDSGKYTLGTETVTEYTYDTVIPGLDIPKDPFVQITDKTAIPVYVYLIIDNDTLPTSMTYTLEDHWKPISEDNSKVYVYSDSNGAIKVTADTNISILQNNTVYVSQHLSDLTEQVKLSFSACMKQYVDDKTTKEIYETT